MASNTSSDAETLRYSIENCSNSNVNILIDAIIMLCSRTNQELRDIQEEYANAPRGAAKQPTALIVQLEEAIEKCKKSIQKGDVVIYIVSAILSDPYQRSDPSYRDVDTTEDREKAGADARRLKDSKEGGEFEEEFRAILFPAGHVFY